MLTSVRLRPRPLAVARLGHASPPRRVPPPLGSVCVSVIGHGLVLGVLLVGRPNDVVRATAAPGPLMVRVSPEPLRYLQLHPPAPARPLPRALPRPEPVRTAVWNPSAPAPATTPATTPAPSPPTVPDSAAPPASLATPAAPHVTAPLPTDSGVVAGPDVDRPPRRARNSPLPHFPVESPAIGGRVTVTFVVEADGTVRPGSLDVLATTEFAFADAVREAVPTLRYRPAQRAGQSVAVRMTEEFAFVRRTSPQP